MYRQTFFVIDCNFWFELREVGSAKAGGAKKTNAIWMLTNQTESKNMNGAALLRLEIKRPERFSLRP